MLTLSNLPSPLAVSASQVLGVAAGVFALVRVLEVQQNPTHEAEIDI